MGSSFKIVDSFSFPKEFGFTQSAVGRHDPKDHPDMDVSEPFGPQKLAKGGEVKPKKRAIGGAMTPPVAPLANTDPGQGALAGAGLPQQGLQGAPTPIPSAQVNPTASRPPSEVGNPVHDAYNLGLHHGARVGAQAAATHLLSSAQRGTPIQKPTQSRQVPGNPMQLPQQVGRASGGPVDEEFGAAHGGMLRGMADGGKISTGGRTFDNETDAYNAMVGSYRDMANTSDEEIAREPRGDQPELRRERSNAQDAMKNFDDPDYKAGGGKFIQGAIKHPHRMQNLASEHGRSVHEEMEHDKHSSDPSLRSAANLGLRLTGGDLKPKRKRK